MPAAKPIAQHRIDGTYRADRHAKRASIEVGDGAQRLDPPKGLHPQLRPLWRRVVSTIDARWLATADTWLLASLVEAIYFQQHAADMLVKLGTIVKTPAGDVHKNPQWMIWRQAVEVVRTLSGKLGLSPMDRARILAGLDLGDDTDAGAVFAEMMDSIGRARQTDVAPVIADEW